MDESLLLLTDADIEGNLNLSENEDMLKGIDMDRLDVGRRQEVQEIAEYFEDKEIDAIDAKILFEITGYQDENFSDWDDYEDEQIVEEELRTDRFIQA